MLNFHPKCITLTTTNLKPYGVNINNIMLVVEKKIVRETSHKLKNDWRRKTNYKLIPWVFILFINLMKIVELRIMLTIIAVFLFLFIATRYISYFV